MVTQVTIGVSKDRQNITITCLLNNLSKLREITGTSGNRLRCEKLYKVGQTFQVHYRFLLKMRYQKLSMSSCQLYELCAAKKKKIKFLPQLLSSPLQNLSSFNGLGKCSRK